MLKVQTGIKSTMKSFRILIVDDSRSVLYYMKEIVTSNFDCKDVILSKDGLDAWKKIQAGKFDLIISDWNMPEMDGEALLRKIRENENTKAIPFLMLTSRTDKDSIITAARAGTTDYLVKPFEETTALARIEKILGVKSKKS